MKTKITLLLLTTLFVVTGMQAQQLKTTRATVSITVGITGGTATANGTTLINNVATTVTPDANGSILISAASGAKVISLDCSGQGLTYLNVSGHKDITTLNCSNNALTFLDIRGCAFTTFNASGQQIPMSIPSNQPSIRFNSQYGSYQSGIMVNMPIIVSYLKHEYNDMITIPNPGVTDKIFFSSTLEPGCSISGNYVFTYTAAVDQDPPACDNILTVTEITSNSVTVTWNKATDDFTPQNELRYRPYYRPISGSSSGFLETLVDVATYTFTGLLPDREYSFVIDVMDNSGKRNDYYVSNIKTLFAIVPVTGVVFNQPPNFFIAGETQTLDYIVSPTNATNKKVTLTSSDPGIITIPTGTATLVAVSSGTATITITTEDGGFTDTRDVTVAVPATGVSLNKTTLALVRGQRETLVAAVAPTDATNKTVTWSSDKPAIVAVDPGTGEIQTPNIGSAVITAKTIDGNFTATCTVTVTAPSKPVTGVTLPATLTLSPGEKETLTPVITPTDATVKDVWWIVGLSSIATVSASGEVTAVEPGTTIVTVHSFDGNLTSTCTVTVTPPVTGVSLNKATLSLVRGEKETLVATVTPAEAKNKTVTWSSDNTAIAAIDSETGEIQAVSVGSAIITAKTVDGNFTATCTITITAPSKPVTGVALPTATLNMEKGNKITLTPAIAPADASIKGVSWTSSNKAVATVSASGEIVAVGGGSATITATTNDGGFTATCAITVTGPIGVEVAEKADTYAAISADILYVTSPAAETISIYSITGSLLYTTNKPSGEIQIPLMVKGSILIVKGSSGWVQRVIKN